MVSEGKFGPYIRYGKQYISIPRGKDPLSLTLEEAISMIEEKRQSSTPLHEWGDIQVLRSKYSAYIHTPAGNYHLPKNTDVESLTEAQVRQIIAQSEPIKPGKRTFRRKNSK